MQQTKTMGIILTVIGGSIGIWVFTRFTSLAGKLHTWGPPFTEYEVTTLASGTIALVLIIVGLINLTKKQQVENPAITIHSNTQPKDIATFIECKKCGKRNPIDLEFCFNCDEKLEPLKIT